MRPVEFWSHVQRGDSSSCWTWLGPKTKRGYGTYRGTTAHRVSYQREVGEIPDGHYVLHRCDNPSCVNPRHLFTGTQRDNIADMFQKGRQGDCRNFGEKHGRCRITDRQIADMLKLRAGGMSQDKLAKQFGISQVQAGRIIRGESRVATHSRSKP